MAAITFDTLAYANALKEADVPDVQAQAHSKALRRVLDGTLSDQAKAQSEIVARAVEQSDTKTEKSIAKLERTIGKIEESVTLLRKDMMLGFSAADAKIEHSRKDLTIKMGGMFIVAVGIILSVLFKLLH